MPRRPHINVSKGGSGSAEWGRANFATSLALQYQIVGRELLRVEAAECAGNLPAVHLDSAFREGVAFINVEVLESYLDDLLNSTISDDRLFIRREMSAWNSYYLPLLGVLLAVASGFAAADFGVSFVFSFCLAALLAVPFALLLTFAPPTGLRRRMAFAQIVSDEVLRRRGRSWDDDGRGASSRQSELEKLMDARLGRLVAHPVH